MDTYLTNPAKKGGKKKGKASSKGGGGKKRRNPGNPPKKRGSARTGARRNPGFGAFIPGAAGGLAFRLGAKKIAGDKFYAPDGSISGTGYIVGAGMLYFSEEVARFLRFQGMDGVAFQGGMAGVAGSMLADKFAPDLAREHLFPMSGAAPGLPPAEGTSGLGMTPQRPMSRDVYLAMAGMGTIGRLGAKVYVQHPDGSVWEYPTIPAGTAGVGQTITLPRGARAGQVIRSRSTGERFKLVAGTDGRLKAVGLSGTRSEYLRAA